MTLLNAERKENLQRLLDNVEAEGINKVFQELNTIKAKVMIITLKDCPQINLRNRNELKQRDHFKSVGTFIFRER